MKRATIARAMSTPRSQAGLGMIELLIVILISLLMLAGLFSIVYGTRQNFLAQNQLAQLQDNERMAMSVLTNVIQTSGYFPNPTATTVAGALPAAGVFAAAGQSVYGVVGDQITVRYVAGTNDGVMDCNGQTNGTGALQNDWNTFYVAGNQLVCLVTANGVAGTPMPIVSGVTGMTILYGVDTNGDGSVDQYLNAAGVTAANLWNSVISVQVALQFTNPLTGTTGTATSASTNGILTLTRTIDLLNRT